MAGIASIGPCSTWRTPSIPAMGIAEDFPYMNVAMVNRRAHEAQVQQLKGRQRPICSPALLRWFQGLLSEFLEVLADFRSI